jgi:DNA-binding response OmpR family regulator
MYIVGDGMRILIIEDEFNLADAIASKLEQENFYVDVCSDGAEGYYKASSGVYDLIILDVMLPNMNGFDILRKLDSDDVSSKIIMLTAKGSLEDKLMGLENGANDYLTKPFHMDELVARIRVQLGNHFKVISYGDLTLGVKTFELRCCTTDEVTLLICKEFQILEFFFNNPNQVLSKEQLYDRVWGIDSDIASNNLEVYLSFIRKKLRALGSTARIRSFRGLGYKMEFDNE